MRKLKFFALAIALLGTGLFCGTSTVHAEAATAKYYIGGMTAGFLLSAGGAEVIGLSEVMGEDGIFRPAEDAGIRIGDTIVAVEGIRVKTITELNEALERSAGKEIEVTVRRKGEDATVPVTPVKDKKASRYKIGVLIRDTLAGIGTVTYIDSMTYRFGALGHAVCDENHNLLSISDPQMYLCSVVGVTKGTRGRAGELRGLFVNDTVLGSAETVGDTGLYGSFSRDYDFSRCELVETAPMSEATIGKAVIYSTVDGAYPQKYDVDIVKVDAANRDNKNFVVKVTDSRLIDETGGIVQGMSGSPILQNGKLIGAVTHVFLNDPTRGYGIGIEKMLAN